MNVQLYLSGSAFNGQSAMMVASCSREVVKINLTIQWGSVKNGQSAMKTYSCILSEGRL
jgi:hypothetical protein